MKNLTFVTIIFFSLMTSSYGYFDPGTGSFILQGIIALFSIIVFYLGQPIRYIKKTIKKIKENFKSKK